MPIKIKLFTMPFVPGINGFASEELDEFLENQEIDTVTEHFFDYLPL